MPTKSEKQIELEGISKMDLRIGLIKRTGQEEAVLIHRNKNGDMIQQMVLDTQKCSEFILTGAWSGDTIEIA